MDLKDHIAFEFVKVTVSQIIRGMLVTHIMWYHVYQNSRVSLRSAIEIMDAYCLISIWSVCRTVGAILAQ